MHKSGTLIRIAATAMSALYALALLLTGTHLPNIANRLLAYSPSALGLLCVSFDLWIWKLPFVQRFVNRPNIAGVWIGEINPTGEKPEISAPKPGVIRSALLVEQTFWTLAVSQFTVESASHSTSASIVNRTESKSHRTVAYIYQNEPFQRVRDRSQPSNGACHLSVAGHQPLEMTGTYWTDRKSTGDVSYKFIGRKTDFASLESVETYEVQSKKQR